MRAVPHVMRASFPRPAALLLFALLSGEGRALAQQAVPVPVPRPMPEDAEAQPAAPAPPEAAEPATVENAAAVGGSWSGWAKLTNDWPGLACLYEPAGDAPTVHLELSAAEPGLHGSVAIDIPAAPGSACPPLRKRYTIAEVRMEPGNASFTDSGGNEWTLAARRGGAVLQGTIAWQQGGPDQPLAEGFTLPNGVRPLSRLTGEVRFRHDDPVGASSAADTAEAAAGPAAENKPAAKKGGAGTHAGNVVKVLGANVVGLGLLWAANELGQGSSAAGVLTCSPRVCIVGAPNAPCFCEGNVVSGSSCGSTTGGVPIGGACDGITQPCQASLSCNSNVCEDRYGRCPY
jgi:hypothetical protein